MQNLIKIAEKIFKAKVSCASVEIVNRETFDILKSFRADYWEYFTDQSVKHNVFFVLLVYEATRNG